MKNYVHARLAKEDGEFLRELREITGQSDSDLVREGLQLLHQRKSAKKSALNLAKKYVGLYRSPFQDLSTDKKHLEGYGQ